MLTNAEWLAANPDWRERSFSHNLDGAELERLFPTEKDGVLIGTRLKLIFERFGIPPCDGCNGRAQWMDDAHRFVLEVWGLA